MDNETANQGPDMGSAGSSSNDNIFYAVSYPIPLAALILLFAKKGDQTARYHALNSLFYWVAATVLQIALWVVTAVISFIPVIGGIIGALIGMVVPVALFGFAIYLGYEAYKGSKPVIPTVTEFMEKTSANWNI